MRVTTPPRPPGNEGPDTTTPGRGKSASPGPCAATSAGQSLATLEVVPVMIRCRQFSWATLGTRIPFTKSERSWWSSKNPRTLGRSWWSTKVRPPSVTGSASRSMSTLAFWNAGLKTRVGSQPP